MPRVREVQGQHLLHLEGYRAICCCILMKYGEMNREKQPESDRGRGRGTPVVGFSSETHGLGAQSLSYLVLLFVVQLFSISIWLSNERVHQHQEGHVE